MPASDHEALVAGLALAHQHLPAGTSTSSASAAIRARSALLQAGEQLHLRQALDLGVRDHRVCASRHRGEYRPDVGGAMMSACARWCSRPPGRRWSRRAGRAGAGRRPGRCPRDRLRRLPHRPAHRRRRAHRAEAAAGARPPGRRRGGRRAGPGAERFAPGDRVGMPWLALGRRRVPLLPLGAREPVPEREVHRLRRRRRLRRARGRRRALLPAAARRTPASRPRRCCAPG